MGIMTLIAGDEGKFYKIREATKSIIDTLCLISSAFSQFSPTPLKSARMASLVLVS